MGISLFFVIYGYNPEINLDVIDDASKKKVPIARERIKSL